MKGAVTPQGRGRVGGTAVDSTAVRVGAAERVVVVSGPEGWKSRSLRVKARCAGGWAGDPESTVRVSVTGLGTPVAV